MNKNQAMKKYSLMKAMLFLNLIWRKSNEHIKCDKLKLSQQSVAKHPRRTTQLKPVVRCKL